jgi:hypothetical protein
VFNPREYGTPDCAQATELNSFTGFAYNPDATYKLQAGNSNSNSPGEARVPDETGEDVALDLMPDPQKKKKSFPYIPVDPNVLDTVGPFIDHIKNIWCANVDESAFEYTLKFLAHNIQRPHEKLQCCLVLKGDPGAGKGLIIMIIAHILGKSYFSQPPTLEDVTTKEFNAHYLEKCLIMFLDEAFWGGSKKVKGALKKLITENFINIGQKYEINYNVENVFHQYMASNEEQVVSMGMKSRRFLVLNLENEYAGSDIKTSTKRKKYFDEILNIDKQILCNYLHSIDISDWNHRAIPSTQAGNEQKEMSMSAEQSFILAVLKDPHDISCTRWIDRDGNQERGVFKSKFEDERYKIDKTILYEKYIQFHKSKKFRSQPKTSAKFFKDWRRYIPKTEIQKTCSRGHHRSHGFVRCITFPTLSEARIDYKRITGLTNYQFETIDENPDYGNDQEFREYRPALAVPYNNSDYD